MNFGDGNEEENHDGDAFFDVVDDEQDETCEDDTDDDTVSQDLGDLDTLPAM